jgi:hypothetical protein
LLRNKKQVADIDLIPQAAQQGKQETGAICYSKEKVKVEGTL